MRDEELDRIWTEYAGPVFRPKWVLPCLRAIARAAAAEEREACAAAADREALDYSYHGARYHVCRNIAAAIRSRGGKGE